MYLSITKLDILFQKQVLKKSDLTITAFVKLIAIKIPVKKILHEFLSIFETNSLFFL